ncbi:hypothetical protein ACFPM0_14320 [Pseudonocardia sulfidoxydans]|uniref:hypothetical protein n=1 Tax=Pseudonocardia sulfidoxydans TaxID=54011 RepID=UPI003612CF83
MPRNSTGMGVLLWKVGRGPLPHARATRRRPHATEVDVPARHQGGPRSGSHTFTAAPAVAPVNHMSGVTVPAAEPGARTAPGAYPRRR